MPQIDSQAYITHEKRDFKKDYEPQLRECTITTVLCTLMKILQSSYRSFTDINILFKYCINFLPTKRSMMHISVEQDKKIKRKLKEIT